MITLLEIMIRNKKLIFMLDNDEAGRVETTSLSEKYKILGYDILMKYPKEKDFNDDLLQLSTSNI